MKHVYIVFYGGEVSAIFTTESAAHKYINLYAASRFGTSVSHYHVETHMINE